MKITFKLLLVVVSMAAMACSRDSGQETAPHVPPIKCPSAKCVQAGELQPGETKTITLSNGADILIQNIGGRNMFAIEGVMTEGAFTALLSELAESGKPEIEKNLILKVEMNKITSRLVKDAKAVALESQASVGYFTALLPLEDELFGALKNVRLPHAVAISPVFHDPDAIRRLKELNPDAEGMSPKQGALATDSSFSGLERIRAPEFVELAQQAIGGGTVDGSSVRLGITDTGITYNHPTFKGADGVNRIVYMKDFTGEGTVFVNPAAKLEVVVPDGGAPEDLEVNAEIIVTPRLPQLPAGDQLVEVKGLKIKVNEDLKKILTTAGNTARLGILLEDSLNADGEPVDLNGNGKLTDKIFMIFVAGSNPAEDRLFVDPSGTADFRQSKPMRDWNIGGEMIKMKSEKVGFSIMKTQLPHSNGEDKVDVIGISQVGYDPGNHGSHVAGIAGGLRTIANDSKTTLARGVAPQAQLLMNRVCSNNAGCNATKAIIDLALNGGAEVINMSLGGLSAFNDGNGVQETIVNRLTSMKNTLFVISAGNSGPGRQTVGSPSTARFSLSVGASAARSLIAKQYQWPGFGTSEAVADSEDFMLFFSSRGPTAAGGFKPNLAAPGTELSSIQLNAVAGFRPGLDVYWGTSMAAPTATGAFALLLDGIKKYNLAHADMKLSTDAKVLRQVLIDTARPFDTTRADLESGEKQTGQFSWSDEGTGLLDLVAAWNKLIELRDKGVPSSVTMPDGTPVELDYEVLTNGVMPNGLAYDGSQVGANQEPAFGKGLYLKAGEADTLKQVFIARRIPEQLAQGPAAGDLLAQLATTRDVFRLRTVVYGSHVQWLAAGVTQGINCQSETINQFNVISTGVEIEKHPDGTGTLKPAMDSILNVCLDRQAMSLLPPGDHGALIYAHRMGLNGQVHPIASFVVPVFLTVPHKTLAGSTAYEVISSVKSFGVSRNYVSIPAGTSIVKIQLEVPEIKTDTKGLPAEMCSGVELMLLDGSNVAKPFASRKEARVANCNDEGVPVKEAKKRRLVFTRVNPTPGIWDINVFGQYRFRKSEYKLRVDYITASTSLKEIAGDLSALNGQMGLAIQEASVDTQPVSEKSVFALNGWMSKVQSTVENKKAIFVEGPLGVLRAYPASTLSVTVTTGDSTGNDIDLSIIECPKDVVSPESPGCRAVAASGGSTDVEKAKFVPRPDRLYAARVDGYDVKDAGKFTSEETIEVQSESGSVAISGQGGQFSVSYGFAADQISNSAILNHPLFVSGKLSASGSLSVKIADETVLASVPVRIKMP